MATYLDRIVAAHRAAAAVDDRDRASLERAASEAGPTRGFRSRLAAVDPIVDGMLASQYAAGGATCLSVLTDADHFGGSVADLQAARAACELPVLRKDFTVCANDVLDARIMGADCVLLIAAVLDPVDLRSFHELATSIGLDVLVEIHDEKELEVALNAGATLIGVNQRDLVTFQVDHERALRMAGVIPESAVPIAESGVRGATDASNLAAAGYRAVLVGESLVTSGDAQAAVSAMRGR